VANPSPDGHVLTSQSGILLRCSLVAQVRMLESSVHVRVADNAVQTLLLVQRDEQLGRRDPSGPVDGQIVELGFELLDELHAEVGHFADVPGSGAEWARACESPLGLHALASLFGLHVGSEIWPCVLAHLHEMGDGRLEVRPT
jgi:hypothetical protein